MKVSIHPQKVSEAKRFYEILNNPNFRFFAPAPKSVEAEVEWIKKSKEKAKKNIEYSYSIICDGEVVGGAGIKIDQQRPHVMELGAFIDEAYWGKGITPKVIGLLEKIAWQKGAVRIELRMDIENKASERVAIKSGYKKEGLLKKAFQSKRGYVDNYLYAKVK